MQPPTFDGRNRNIHALDRFINDYKTYCIAQRIVGQQKLDLFDSLIRPPASQEYEAALTDDNQMIWPDALGDAATPEEIATDQAARLVVRIAWLRNQYQGPRQYQSIRASLTLLKQGSHESPRDFYFRVVNAYSLSGYPEAAKIALIEETWERGVDLELQRIIRQGPNRELEEKLEVADNSWMFRNNQTTAYGFEFLEQAAPDDPEPII